ncbi:TetR/AcrR family transcriptional regulator [Sphingomonas sp. GB1N7]|uniref:TetR/AcrR family transcriptional regulator n=1 Tax=Parasphingomonas caseinilytica TaxID=3096158 RepID=UPI002FC94BFE
MAMQPAAGLHQLGEAAGVSRATLYRLSPTRDELVELLRQACIGATRDAMERARIDQGDPLVALTDLTRFFIADAELYAFGFTDPPHLGHGPTGRDDDWVFYHDRMIQLFQRGVRNGAFGSDLPTDWMLLAYDGLLKATLMALLRGTIARATAPSLMMTLLVKGIA